MQRFQDIQISDNLLKSQFFNYFLNGDYQMAFDLINHNSQLDSKAFVANFINEIAEVLYATEDSVDTETLGKLRELSLDFNEIINQFLNRYDYDSTATYELYNFVIYNNEVYMYINNIPSTGNIPTNTTYWLKIGLRGEKGAGGCSQLQMKFYWQEGIAYQPFDLVITIPQGTTNTGDMWVAKVANINQYPTEDSVYWEKFIEASNGFIYSSKTQPVDRYIGQIWLDMASYIYQTDSEVAYSKIVPNNSVSADVLSMGGKSLAFNQKFDGLRSYGANVVIIPHSGESIVAGHKYYIRFKADENVSVDASVSAYVRDGGTNKGSFSVRVSEGAKAIKTASYGGKAGTNTTTDGNFWWYIYLAGSVGTISDINIFDLTAMFGAGNEPTVEQFEAMFPDAYYPYTAGKIVSADVDEVEVRGRNIYQGIADGSAYCDIGETIPIGTQITFSCDITEIPPYSLYYYDENIEYISAFAVRTGTIGSRFSQTITATKPIRYVFKPTADILSNIQIEKGATATQYAPYSVQNTPIPTAIRNLPCYGCGIGDVYNEVDFKNKQYIQRIDILELNVDDMNNSEDFPGWNTVSRIREICGIGVNDTIDGLFELGTKIGVNTTGAQNTVFFAKWLYGLTQSEWKSKYAGTTLHLYIKRVEPIITDISDLLTFNFKNIKVEGGGKITFHQSNKSYHLEIPNSIKYKIREE